ncbi:S41 family peptidase [Thalassotalea marina]|uniref:Tricorn protease homolog n=1 Tax=Thalassotalea marina TaxID=1673741 RepID=A0A919EJS3_9GAMM|nr:S41 family peptidase [Thalassotalea marina]GHF89208.1 tricorn protease [Thalassotalea marina]
MKTLLTVAALGIISAFSANAEQETRLLRQPTISEDHISFIYGGDVWLADLKGNNVKRMTSTAAVETEPHFSPDGKTLAFSSNRQGQYSVYTVPINGGEPTRLTWHASDAMVKGWTPDGKSILFSSTRDTAPKSYHRLWTVPVSGGATSLVSSQWGFNGAYADNGKQLIIDRMSRWDTEWRNYRGGQNTPLVLLDTQTQEEVLLPNEKSVDIEPVWLKGKVYFLSDRDWVSNVWSYDPKSKKLEQLTEFKNADIKQLASNGKKLAFEQNGDLYTFDVKKRKASKLKININADFPWAETKWQNVSRNATNGSLSPSGKRALFEARGEIFTVPTEHGTTRNLTQDQTSADRAPIWSPNGDKIAWFSDQGEQGYQLLIQSQDGLGDIETISIGESKMAWEPQWSPDGKYIAFVDDDVRYRLIDLSSKTITTLDVGGNNLERGRTGLTWSPDSKWLSYGKQAANGFSQIYVWSLEQNKTQAITNPMANSISPAWDRDGKHFYFLASTDYGLDSGWANTSSMSADHEYAPYIINLTEKQDSPFALRSDEEKVKATPESKDEANSAEGKDDADNDQAENKPKKKGKKDKEVKVVIDFDNIERRIMPLPMPEGNYRFVMHGPKGHAFFAKRADGSRGLSLEKYSIKDRKAKSFISGVSSAVISADNKKLLVNAKNNWHVVDATKANAKLKKPLKLALETKLNRQQEWRQMFVEAWRYQRDYFYDPNMHGRDWNEVFSRYEPLVKHVKHRADLTYLLDMVNGELSVGHSFVYGGDHPKVEQRRAGLLGADLAPDQGFWQIQRIYTAESWNPKLKGPLDQPNVKVANNHYIVAINGEQLTAKDNPFKLLDGTKGKQITLTINDKPSTDDTWTVIVEPIGSENSLRQRTWVEDNRRLVDKLSDGKLAYVWVPNTSSPGFTSFNRYYFAQQDKMGAVIDERFNGGGLLDDYMVDLMNRELRAAITNEVPNGKPMLLPAGIKGPKVLLINELAGSGGDYFPWAFRQQKVGKLIGATTWGGVVKSSVHYPLVDGGRLTAPDNAVFDPINNEWVGENIGIAPDIFVYQDAKSLSQGKDPQLERAVQELMKQLAGKEAKTVKPPRFSTPAIKP